MGGVVVRLLLIVLAAIGTGANALEARAAAEPRPNIVVIMTDDQRADAIDRMPELQARLVQRGITFTNAFHVNPLCCPARASTLTGLAPQRTYVWTNGLGPFGGWLAFHRARTDRSTVAVWLQRAGYRTGGFGKYMNRYTEPRGKPPGWSQWKAFQNGSLTNENGVRRRRLGYKTDVLAGWATSFIRSTPRSKPFFLYVATTVPHAPAIPAARHAEALPDLAPFSSPAFNEADVSDKPAYIQARPAEGGNAIAGFRLAQYRSLLAVDEAVGRIVATLRATRRLANTLIVFTSDNGVQYGEHRLQAAQKLVPYEGSIRAPLIVRWDKKIPVARTEDRLVTDLDYAPTFTAAAGRLTPPHRRAKPPAALRRGSGCVVAELDPDRGHGPWHSDPELVRRPHGDEQVRGVRDGRGGALRPRRRSVRAREPGRRSVPRAELEAGRTLARRLCFPLPPATQPAALCLTAGTSGPDVILETTAAAYVCTRGGRDQVLTGAFADTVEASPTDAFKAQAVSLRPRRRGAAGSAISTAAGNDRIAARNGLRDTIDCGVGVDWAVVDHFDRLSGCERVERPPVPAG